MVDQCLILAGGLAERKSDGALTSLRPVGGAPFLEGLIRDAARRGFRKILLLAGHKPEPIARFVAGGDLERRFKCEIHVLFEPRVYGSGGALAQARPYVHEEFLLLNGDSWFDFNWRDLCDFGRKSGAAAALSLRRPVEHDLSFTLDEGNALQLREGRARDAWNSGGVAYMTARALDGLSIPSAVKTDLWPSLIAARAIKGKIYDGAFLNVATPATATLAPKRPAVFLDRDGVINVDSGYRHTHIGLEWVPGAREAVKAINDAGYFVFVVTNQAGIARGFYEASHVNELHDWMNRELHAAGAYIDDWRFSPYHPEGIVEPYAIEHPWRKPGPGMLLDLMAHWPVDRARSFMIGDRVSDVQAAEAAGMPGYLFESGDLLTFLKGLPAFRSMI